MSRFPRRVPPLKRVYSRRRLTSRRSRTAARSATAIGRSDRSVLMGEVNVEGARASLMAWRRAERERLLDMRMKMSVADRQQASRQIEERLDAYCRDRGLLAPGRIVSGYWPLRGEPDLRPWLIRLNEEGMVTVLPVVVEKGTPLRFRRWTPGCAMEKGFWNIPVPAAPEEFMP